MLIILDINKDISIIDLVFAPTNIIISVPNATLGKLLIIVRYGSNIFDSFLLNHKIDDIINPIMFPKIKLIIISFSVIKICINKL